mgnify:FL=1
MDNFVLPFVALCQLCTDLIDKFETEHVPDDISGQAICALYRDHGETKVDVFLPRHR